MNGQIYDLKRMLLEILSEEIKERIQETARLATLVHRIFCILKSYEKREILEDRCLMDWDAEIESFLERTGWYE